MTVIICLYWKELLLTKLNFSFQVLKIGGELQQKRKFGDKYGFE